jgi:hypothetical protein
MDTELGYDLIEEFVFIFVRNKPGLACQPTEIGGKGIIIILILHFQVFQVVLYVFLLVWVIVFYFKVA